MSAAKTSAFSMDRVTMTMTMTMVQFAKPTQRLIRAPPVCGRPSYAIRWMTNCGTDMIA